MSQIPNTAAEHNYYRSHVAWKAGLTLIWPLTPRVEVAVDLLAHDRLAMQAAHALFRTLHLAEHHSTQAYTVNMDQLDYYNALRLIKLLPQKSEL